MHPLDFINTLRESDRYIQNIYLSGGCYQLYLILKTIFPDATPYINAEKDHVVTKIDEQFYDITGIVTGSFTHLTKDEVTMCETWSFARNYWLFRECPQCEEPVFAPANNHDAKTIT